MEDSRTYWAALEPDKLAKRAYDKVCAYRRWFRSTGYATKAIKGWRMANGLTDAGETSSRLQMGGERMQLVKAVINGVRPLRQRIVSMVLSGTPEMQPIASNSDADAREQADLSRVVLQHLHRVHRREKRDKKALDMALDMGTGALCIEWDARAGKAIAMDPETNRPAAWEGDLRYWLTSPFDFYWDAGLRDREDAAWVIARRWVPRHRLAAQYPEKADRILALAVGTSFEDGADFFDARMFDATTETDLIPEYVLWHLDKPELEGGRELRFLSDGTWLTDGGYPYDGDMLPVFPLSPDEVACTSLGYTNIFDVLGVSDLVNSIVSAMATNLTKGMVPPLLNPKGSGMSLGAPIGTGHTVLDVSDIEKAPRPMEMPSTPPEAYKALEVLERWRLEGVGLNETAIGRPPYSGMAAQAMALLDSKVDQYNEGLQKGVVRFREDTATFELRILKKYAHEERIAQVAGKAKQWMAKAYSAEKLAKVDAFHVEPVGAASRSLAGKFGLLETFGSFGVPLSPEQIVELAQTGQYESDFEAPLANRYRIREENEGLMEGKVPPILMPRPHWQDIPEHLALLGSPAIIDRPDVVEAVLSTVSQKLELWRSMPPDLLALLGGPPPPGVVPPPMPGAEAPVDQAGPGAAPPPEGAAAGAVNALDPNAEAPDLPQPPEMAA